LLKLSVTFNCNFCYVLTHYKKQ
uniref:Uncharacterized protein n=1 Tax=Amphimedon queenslandica TaxID=400682 RepID=A0A1X7SWR2_AMPQE